MDISLLINNFTHEGRQMEETESKSEERPCLQADDHESKIFIVQLLCARQWGIMGISQLLQIVWEESNKLQL